MADTELVRVAVDTVRLLSDKVRESVTLGKPWEATEYSQALRDCAAAYRDLVEAREDE